MDIAASLRRHEDRILGLANVTGIGIGENLGRPVIKVFVSRKLPADQLAPGQLVPATLDGYPTAVEEIGIVTAQPGLR